MKITVRLDAGGSREEPFVMTVTGANHRIETEFSERFANHGDVWNAARRIGEAECDWLTRASKGWGS